MAEKTKRLEKALQNKKGSHSCENNNFTNPYLSPSSRSESGSVIRKRKTAPKPLTPRSHSFSHSIERQKKIEMESLHAIPINATLVRMKQNNATGSNCSPSPVRRRFESLSTGRENNSSSRLEQPAEKFIPNSDNVIFFKQLWEKFINRYPEWVQQIWRKRQQERRAEYLQEASERRVGDKTLNDTRNAEESIRYVGNMLTAISEEEQDSSFCSLRRASIAEAFDTMDDGNEGSIVTHCEQSSSSSRSLERNSSEICEVCDKVTEWREWSLQLTSDGKLIITGKSEQNALTKSRDVSSWERVDAHTLKHRRDGTVYKLVGAADHFVCQDLPSYVRTKFQYGFPEKWLEIMDMWMKYRKEGNPPNFIWSADTDYNGVKPRLNRTFTGSRTVDVSWNDHIPVVPSEDIESLKSKMPIKQNVSEKQKKAKHTKREAMSDLSNITYKRPLHKAYSLGMLSPKAVNETTSQKDASPKKESNKEAGKKLKASKKTKNVPQELRNWYPLLSERRLKFSGFLESGQKNVKHTTNTIVTAVRQTQIVSCTSGERYQLIGDLEGSACTAPEFIKTKFKTGIPYRWKLVVEEWIQATELSQHSQKEQTYAESDAKDQDVHEITLENLAASGNLKKSKRGRVMVPPLQHWLGERITLYGDNPVYCPSPSVAAKLQSCEQLDLKSPRAKKKKGETPVSSKEEVKMPIHKGIKTRLILS